MQESDSNELRRHPRFAVELQVKLRFSDVNRFRTFTTQNLSEGGLFVVSDTPKSMGAWVQIVLYPPGIELGLPILGNVVRRVSAEDAKARGIQPGMGIRFEDLDEDAHESLNNLVKAVAQDAKARPAPAQRPPARPPPPPPPAARRERRREVRHPARSAVRLRFSDADQFRDFYVKDLSRGGVFVCTGQPLARGSEVELILTPPDNRADIRLEGRVAHVVEPSPDQTAGTSGMGIEFTRLTHEKRNEVAQYVREVTGASPEMLGKLQPVATAHVRYEAPAAFQIVVRSDLRKRRLFVVSAEPRPIGTKLRILVEAPQIEKALELEAEVESVVTREESERSGGKSGMMTRLTNLTDELLADIDLRVRRHAGIDARGVGESKAAKLLEAAVDDLQAGKRSSAVANVKLALKFDPNNAECIQLLEDLTR